MRTAFNEAAGNTPRKTQTEMERDPDILSLQ